MFKQNIKKMVGVAFLIAMIFVMQYIGGLIPSVSGFNISLVLLPIVLGAIVFGPGSGALLGATFGIITFINCVTGADPGGAMVFQASPLLCLLVVVLKGTLAGLASGWVYRLLHKGNSYLAALCASIVCPVVNTGVFLACMGLFFMEVLTAWAQGGSVLAYVLSGLVLANFLPELVINVVFSPIANRIQRIVK